MSVECTLPQVSSGPYHPAFEIRTLRSRRAPPAGPSIEVVRCVSVVDYAIGVFGDGVVAAGHQRFCVHGPTGMRHNRESACTGTYASTDEQNCLDRDDAERE